MKNKNIRGGGGVLSTQPDQQKRPQCRNAQKMQKIIKHCKFFLARSAHSAFHISGAAYRHALVQYAEYVLFFFFLSSHHDTSPLLHLYHFR